MLMTRLTIVPDTLLSCSAKQQTPECDQLLSNSKTGQTYEIQSFSYSIPTNPLLIDRRPQFTKISIIKLHELRKNFMKISRLRKNGNFLMRKLGYSHL